jgi:hypothetical protein
MKYNYLTLSEFCNDNNIILCEDYSIIPLSRETFITGICEVENCDKQFTKGFRALLKPNGYCQDCAKIFGKEKAKKTNFKKYGVEFTTQAKKVKDKIKKTCLEKYGVEHISLIKEVKEKTKQTCLKKYGVETPAQNPDIAEKQSKNAYKSKVYTFPSGRIENVQGAEPYALDYLLNISINEDDIFVGVKNVPTIWYLDNDNKKHRHYVDIFIKSLNKCIEVKSTWTAKKKNDNIFLKQNAAKELGYEYEIWIFDGKNNLVETFK